MAALPSVQEVQCRTALNRVSGMGFRWSLNPYRGCQHGCHYCYARHYHTYWDRDPNDGFSGLVDVKVNVAEVLRRELARPSWRRELVAVGTATDPYQPLEARYRLTRRCLQVLHEFRTPVQVATRGTLVIRDADLLAAMTRAGGASVAISLVTLREDLIRRLEPGAPPAGRRLWALEQLARVGVRVGVLLAPVLPGWTDAPGELEAVVAAAARAGAHFVWPGVLRLMEGTRGHFLGYLSATAPAVADRYRRLYPRADAPVGYAASVRRRVEALAARYGLGV
ncbi:MAG: radical SAM protein, partial [Clostridia bacterium]|nr:radical SAM protein [Clostridia bacterium]